MLKLLLLFLLWVGACTGVYYLFAWKWAVVIFALVSLLGFLGWALVRAKRVQ